MGPLCHLLYRLLRLLRPLLRPFHYPLIFLLTSLFPHNWHLPAPTRRSFTLGRVLFLIYTFLMLAMDWVLVYAITHSTKGGLLDYVTWRHFGTVLAALHSGWGVGLALSVPRPV